jgi:hypothetical protein
MELQGKTFMPNTNKLTVDKRSLFDRINTRLVPNGLQLHASRSLSAKRAVGKFYAVNNNTGSIAWGHADPGALALELGVLSPWEQVEPRLTGYTPVPQEVKTALCQR